MGTVSSLPGAGVGNKPGRPTPLPLLAGSARGTPPAQPGCISGVTYAYEWMGYPFRRRILRCNRFGARLPYPSPYGSREGEIYFYQGFRESRTAGAESRPGHTCCPVRMAEVTSKELQRGWGAVLDRVLRGEVVDVTRNGRPVLRISRIDDDSTEKAVPEDAR